MNYKSIGIKKVKIIQNHNTNISELKNKSSSYQCPFCNKCFEKGQGLGGHMSRHHPKQSEKYKYYVMKSILQVYVDEGGKKFRKSKFKSEKDLCKKMLDYFDNVMVEVEKYTGGYPYKA